MKKIFRDKLNADYWEGRWQKSGVDENGFKNKSIYPIKYAEMAIKEGDRILEAGCGAGRVYFHYKHEGKNIEGIEYSQNAVENILKKEPDAEVIEGSITELPYDNNSFDVVLSFGLYHNIEDEEQLQKAFDETYRVLSKGGKVVASVRFDSLENNIIENIVKRRVPDQEFNKFHRWHLSLHDMERLLGTNMEIEQVIYARNVSFLFKFDLFRSRELKMKNFVESKARSGGFELNTAGKVLDAFLHTCFPRLFSNLLVIIAKKTD